MSAGYGFAFASYGGAAGGWGKLPTANGKIPRATSIVDTVRRLLRPLWGPVWSEPHRGNAARPKKMVDAMPVITADRARLVLDPLVKSGEIAMLKTSVSAHPYNPERNVLTLEFVDAEKRPYELTEFVRVP